MPQYFLDEPATMDPALMLRPNELPRMIYERRVTDDLFMMRLGHSATQSNWGVFDRVTETWWSVDEFSRRFNARGQRLMDGRWHCASDLVEIGEETHDERTDAIIFLKHRLSLRFWLGPMLPSDLTRWSSLPSGRLVRVPARMRNARVLPGYRLEALGALGDHDPINGFITQFLEQNDSGYTIRTSTRDGLDRMRHEDTRHGALTAADRAINEWTELVLESSREPVGVSLPGQGEADRDPERTRPYKSGPEWAPGEWW